MQKFERLTGKAVPMVWDNIDTDAIMPTAWIVTVGSDWGRGVFGTRRRNGGFVIDEPRYAGATILVGGRNFGCGSSREEAVWGLVGHGFRCVIAAGFSDIFFDNACKNGLLPVVLPHEEVAAIGDEAAKVAASTMTVDLVERVVTTPAGRLVTFSLDEGRREALLQGLDDVGMTLARAAEIDAFQAGGRIHRPWIYNV